MSGTSYKAAGVDIDAGNETVRRIKSIARGTFTPGVLSEIGSFGGLFSMALAILADIAPTLLALLGVPQSKEMTGQSLVVKK